MQVTKNAILGISTCDPAPIVTLHFLFSHRIPLFSDRVGWGRLIGSFHCPKRGECMYIHGTPSACDCLSWLFNAVSRIRVHSVFDLLWLTYQLALALDCGLDLRVISIFYTTVHI
jgi:hypothetical protein